MAKSKRYAKQYNRDIMYAAKEPKKRSKVNIPVQEIDILDMYQTIDRVPDDLKSEYLKALLA